MQRPTSYRRRRRAGATGRPLTPTPFILRTIRASDADAFCALGAQRFSERGRGVIVATEGTSSRMYITPDELTDWPALSGPIRDLLAPLLTTYDPSGQVMLVRIDRAGMVSVTVLAAPTMIPIPSS